MKDWGGWIHRRVESIGLSDAKAERRRVSIDFTLPESCVAISTGSGGVSLHFVPIAMLRKGPLTDFNLRDESGNALPLLTKRRNGTLAASVLKLFAEERLAAAKGAPTALPPEIAQDIEEIAVGTVEAAEEESSRLKWCNRLVGSSCGL